MLPLRIAFDVLAQLHFTDVEYAAALHAASTISLPSDPWGPPATARLIEAMSSPSVVRLVTGSGGDEARWNERIAAVRSSEVLVLAIEYLAAREDEIPQAWMDELLRARRPSLSASSPSNASA